MTTILAVERSANRTNREPAQSTWGCCIFTHLFLYFFLCPLLCACVYVYVRLSVSLCAILASISIRQIPPPPAKNL